MEPVVDIKDLSFTYSGSASPALREINLQVYPGEFITITGPSGCGKSTLALCLAGFIPHAYAGKMEGTIHIQGKDTIDYPAGGLSGIVGLVQQDPEAQLCTLTVSDEVAFGPENLCIPPAEIGKRIYEALQAVGAWHLKDRKVHTLSGGEKQRVAIASVLAMHPALLILDEPTANLDPSCAKEVLQTLQKLKEEQNISIIVIEHRLERFLAVSDRLLHMQCGRFVVESASIDNHKPLTPSYWNPIELQRSKLPKTQFKNQRKEPVLSVQNIKAGYEEHEVLRGISFEVYAGETIAIMGDNGSGKTTLLQTLLGTVKPCQGRICLQGKDLSTQKVPQRAKKIGLTFQNPNHQIFGHTVFEEASLAARFLGENTRERNQSTVNRLLEEFELMQYHDSNPFILSLGEKKRLTLISVLAYDPLILILDEPLAGQDKDRLGLLLKALGEHSAQGGIVLMVCHEPTVAFSFCSRVLFISEGKLLIDAPAHEAQRRLAQLGRDEYLTYGYGYLPGLQEGGSVVELPPR
ncbi:MAG: ABC transporter ATP-binding protein [Syntrophomonadaceae bacterium]|mgnify:FL=1